MAEDLSGYLAGLVLSCEEVPKKDKLKKLSIDVGAAEPVDVVTNAGNVGTRTVDLSQKKVTEAHADVDSRRASETQPLFLRLSAADSD